MNISVAVVWMPFKESLNQRLIFCLGALVCRLFYCQWSTTSSESSVHHCTWVWLLYRILGAEVGFLAASVPQTWVTLIKGYCCWGELSACLPGSLFLGDKRQKSSKKEETEAHGKSEGLGKPEGYWPHVGDEARPSGDTLTKEGSSLQRAGWASTYYL